MVVKAIVVRKIPWTAMSVSVRVRLEVLKQLKTKKMNKNIQTILTFLTEESCNSIYLKINGEN